MTRKKKNRDSFSPSPWGQIGYSNTPPSQQLIMRQAYMDKWRTFFMRIALGRFKWHGLPDSISERFLERTLLLQTRGIFFEMGDELLATQVIPQGPPDLYDNFNKYRAQGANGQTFDVADGEGVVIYDSLGRFPSWSLIEPTIIELTELDLIQMSNLKQQRSAVVVSVPEESKGDATKLLNALEMNEHSIVVSTEFQKNVVADSISTGVEYKQKDYHEDRTAKLNNAYLMLGIDHVPFEKQAHMLESEAEKSTDSVMRIRDDLLNARRAAAEQVNKKFGTNISVEWNSGEEQSTEAETNEEELS